jgi:enoyl-CoA hydratase/carnithine racemase
MLVPADEVRAAAMGLANEIAECAPLALSSTWAIMRTDLAERVARATEHELHELHERSWLKQTADFKERLKATTERRLPH